MTVLLLRLGSWFELEFIDGSAVTISGNSTLTFSDPGDKRTAKITWKKSNDAAGYIIRYGIAPGKLYTQYQVMGKTELKINSLNRDMVYYFAIDVYNENGYTKVTHVIESK